MINKYKKSIIVLALFLVIFFIFFNYLKKTEKQKIILHDVVVEGGVVDEPVDLATIQPWNTVIINYAGNYGYGFSESESTLVLDIKRNIISATIKSGKFNKDGTEWIVQNTNLHNIRIEGNKFYSDEWNGEFISFIFENQKEYGLRLYGYVKSKPGEPIIDEIGFYSSLK